MGTVELAAFSAQVIAELSSENRVFMEDASLETWLRDHAARVKAQLNPEEHRLILAYKQQSEGPRERENIGLQLPLARLNFVFGQVMRPLGSSGPEPPNQNWIVDEILSGVPEKASLREIDRLVRESKASRPESLT